MSEKRKYLRFALGGLAACMLTGGVFGYVQLKQNPELSRNVPAMGLPNGYEFVDMLDETRLYWSHKLDSAALFETFTVPETAPFLMVSDLEELPEGRAAFERKIIESLGLGAKETPVKPQGKPEPPADVMPEQTSDDAPEEEVVVEKEKAVEESVKVTDQPPDKPEDAPPEKAPEPDISEQLKAAQELPALEVLPPVAEVPVRKSTAQITPDLEPNPQPPPPSVTEQTAVEISKPVDAIKQVEAAPVAEIPPPPEFTYEIEEETIQVEGVLVPQKKTVISSSRDGRIKEIFVDHGDIFAAGDILLSYDCNDLNAEVSTLQAAEALAKKKAEQALELFKLDIISELEQEELEVERQQAAAQNEVLKTRMEACIIRASYDGRVTNRLANPQEYTRTDRVLMEVASRGVMEVEFIVPSKWLRYVNIGAPLRLTIAETEQTYPAIIHQIYGEVDPVSQSIQMSATLLDQKAVLLPGMSGLVEINASEIRQEGIRGYLEPQRTAASGDWRRISREREGPNG